MQLPLYSRDGEVVAHTQVDEQDYPSIASYRLYMCRRAGGYAIATVDGRRMSLHRLLTGVSTGTFVDHADGDSLNNRRANLRHCTPSENKRNSRKRVDTGNRFKGVDRGGADHRQRGYFRARVRYNGKRYNSPWFRTEEEAARWYDAKAIELHGPFARTNASLGLLPQ